MKTRLLPLLCALLLTLSPVSLAAPVDEVTRAADTLFTLGLVKGTGSGYALSSPATRVQAAAVLLRLSGCEAQGAPRTAFTDLPAWAADSVNYAYARGWVCGTSSTTFSPNQPITGNAYCALLLRLLGYRDAQGDFTVPSAALFARHIGLTSLTYGSQPLTRGDLFRLSADALRFSYRGSEESVVSRLVSQGVVSRATANALGLLDGTLTARQVYDRYAPATFLLRCYADQAHLTSGEASSYASGFFITDTGLAVTCYHAVKGAIAASVTLATGETYPVERVVYYDRDIDFAVLRISRCSTTGAITSAFAHLTVAGTGDIHAGDVVYSLGHPLGLELSIASGIISDPYRPVDRYALPCIMNTADISQGSSGGALLNDRGEVIGLTSGAYLLGNSMYLAVPADPALTADLSAEGATLYEVAAAQAEYDAANAAA